jgi:glutathione-regulated potassium-efflux system protein KefB
LPNAAFFGNKHSMTLLQEAIIYLAAAVVAVPLCKKLGLGAVLGYLVAGMLIGPGGLGLIGDVEAVLHFSELGVTLLLFLIGLELQPARLWQMRRLVFGLGGAQLVLTTAAIAGVLCAFGQSLSMAVLVGLGLSLSSTAGALQLLAEKNQMADKHGRAAFGILLLQDLAVIPLMAALPVLAGDSSYDTQDMGLRALRVLVILGAVAASKFVLRPLLRLVASVHMHELFAAVSLLVVVGIAELVGSVGLSMGLGAFLAGMLFADSEYRHALEADIEPFKGLLLGLFFMAVGMSVNVELIAAQPAQLAAAVAALVGIKALVLFATGLPALKSRESAVLLSMTLSQGGEFAFVIFSLATTLQLMDRSLYDFLLATVTLSMAVTPLLFAAYGRWMPRRPQRRRRPDVDVAPETETPVIIAGFGRIGQVIGRILRARRIPFTALDTNPEHIDFIKKYGNKVFYGDASRLDILRAAKAETARVFVLAISDEERSLRCAMAVQKHFPHLLIVARARNRNHAYRLMNLGITHVMRETYYTSLKMTSDVLTGVGLTYSDSKAAVERFVENDLRLMRDTAGFFTDEERLMKASKRARRELQRLFEEEL